MRHALDMSPPRQLVLFKAPDPPGFLCTPEVISPVEERELVAWFSASPGWNDITFRGQKARRRAMSFGARYLAQGKQLLPAPALPPELAIYRDRMVAAACAGLGAELVLAGRSPRDFALCTALYYPPGAGIGWHSDNRAFGPTVLSLSLGAPARLQLRPATDADASIAPIEVMLEPRSLFVLAGEVRSTWHHRIRPVSDARYSLNIRTPADAPPPG
jgi:alkylated DNA repair dioxygenase AlkB